MLQKILFYFLICSNGFIFGQTTLIPDLEFEEALIERGIDLIPVPNGSIPTSWISDIILLNVSLEGIDSLDGIEDFTSLEQLDCSSNSLTSLDLSANLNLTAFSCYANNIDTLILGDKPNLLSLATASNNIKYMDLSLAPNLTEIWSDQNELVELDLSNNLALEDLHCDHNNLTELNLDLNLNLWRVECGGNLLTDIDLSMLSQLQYFKAVNNVFTDLDLTSNSELIKVRCDYGLIENLFFDSHPYLTSLECTDNNLTALDLTATPNLEELYCQNNAMTYIDLSLNPNLWSFYFFNNNFELINLKNGNNTILTSFWGTDNTDLYCLNVDNVAFSTANWTGIDDASVYSEECFTAIENEADKMGVIVYPNPFTDFTTINFGQELRGDQSILIYDVLGQEVYRNEQIIGQQLVLSRNDLNAGVYLMILVNEEDHSTVMQTKLIAE